MFGSGRGVGVTDALHGYAEWPVILLFALTTQLGDVWFIFLLGGGLYVAGDEFPRWGIDRRRGLFVVGLVLTYVALIGVLKHIFLLPRPPGAGEPPAIAWLPTGLSLLLESTATADGPGFPSGHALGTTMFWGGLALVVEHWTAWKRFGAAAAIVALVSLSRLVLGVHYLVDVVVGAALGAVVLGALYLLADRGTDPVRVLHVAVAVGVAGLLVGVTFDSVAAVGGATGGWLVWRGVADSTPAHPTNRREVVAGFVALVVSGALFGAVYALTASHLITFVGTAVAVGGAVAAPLLGERLV
ncbi:phosphatase PAP2 family protein [Halorussus rarus]|uniref:phosphatase PAP2 family protein n=1 Tax=Halorussus TaxID=1070314 RepID=UPI000E20F8BB|nr:phosphatase PAP2 family protein [Halorussus rarus]NHN61484.1 phosphatase PAP2 family protein [Halorussus sp. JP-T4]